MENQSWMNNPKLKNIDPQKLMLLTQLYNQAGNKSMNEIFPFLLAATANLKKSGVSFSKEEFDLIFDALKQGKSKEELQKMNQLIQMFRMLNTGK